MAITVTLNAVESSAADINVLAAFGSLAQGGWVDGITDNPDTFLAQVFAAVNAKVPPGTNYPGTSLPYRRLVAKAAGPESAAVQLIYSNEGGQPPNAFMISTRAYLSTVDTNLILATGEQLFVDWKDPKSGARVPSNTVRDQATISMREITVQGIRYGEPDYDFYEGFNNYVNQEKWRNRDPGFWKCSDGGVDASPLTGTYGYHVTAITRNIIDWSEVRDLKNPLTGITLPVKLEDQKKVAAAKYKQGIIMKVNGRTRYGQYPLTNFTELFGFNGIGKSQQPLFGLYPPTNAKGS